MGRAGGLGLLLLAAAGCLSEPPVPATPPVSPQAVGLFAAPDGSGLFLEVRARLRLPADEVRAALESAGGEAASSRVDIEEEDGGTLLRVREGPFALNEERREAERRRDAWLLLLARLRGGRGSTAAADQGR